MPSDSAGRNSVAETRDAPPPEGVSAGHPRHPETARRHVALVEGSTPHLRDETAHVIRNRLRIVALLFFVGFLAFLIKSLFDLPYALTSKPEMLSNLI